MMFGPWGNDDRADAVRIIHTALDAGINFVDTADVYSDGVSEEIVGEALRGRRDDVVLATKFFVPMGEDPNQRGGSRRWIVREVENSLRRLGTDHIDLYQVHRPSADTDVEETLGALTDLVRQGKVRYIGSSSYSGSQIVEAQWAARSRNLERFVTEQPPYSILVRGIEMDVLPTTLRHGMGTLTYSPLSAGWLSGAWGRDFHADLARASAPRGPVRHVPPGEPAQAQGGGGARQARRGRRSQPDRARDRLRHPASRRDVGDHRSAHDGPARVPAARRRRHARR
jgi:aryl-alcohol dehydrogenase-like predicted oxidoreductase